MLFNSIPFLLFALLFFALWPLAKRNTNFRYFLIVIFSFIFYGWWDWRFLFLLIFSGLVDWVAALLIVRQRHLAGLWLLVSMGMNIGSLMIFKYSGFIASTADSLFAACNIHTSFRASLPDFSLILPVGISFYTFQSMSYTIDVYRRQLTPTKNILHFFSYLALFPQLVAGPIVRASDLLYQIQKVRPVGTPEIWNGLKLIAFGYFQKMVLADNIAHFVNSGFSGINTSDSWTYWWLLIIGFALQIYFDFCGYSSIARGLAKLMGYHFRINFNHPYHATSIRDFWQRWHISLSTWFRDYVYIPLGGGKKGKVRSHINLWITMLISGLWHGAAFTFIIWGAIHAFFTSFERITGWTTWLYRKRWLLFSLFGWIFVMMQVCLAWVFFRAESLGQAFSIIGNMFSGGFSLSFFYDNFNSLVFLIIGICAEFLYYLKRKFNVVSAIERTIAWDAVVIALMVSAVIFFRGPEQQFIYFQF